MLAAGSEHPLLLLLDAIKPCLLCISQSAESLEKAALQHVLQDCSHPLCSSRGDAEDTEVNSIHLLQACSLKLTSTAREAVVTGLLSLSAAIAESVWEWHGGPLTLVCTNFGKSDDVKCKIKNI